MSSPTSSSRRARRTLALRVLCGVVAFGSLGGIFLGSLPSHADAAADSSVTVDWANDSGPDASYQPSRPTDGFEYNEFKNIKVTVGQTQNLIDQAVKINVTGFQDGTEQASDGTGQIWTTAMNFMQAMQCWGDPNDPNFRQTCEWGGRFVSNNGLGFSVYGDNVYREAAKDVSPDAVNPVDVPFVTRDGESFTGRQVYDQSGTKQYPILDEYNADSSNEQLGARIDSDGTGNFDFETQTDIEAPQLGCGRDSTTGTAAQQAAYLKCYLVLVPRGTVYGGHDSSCSSISAPPHGETHYAYGQSPAIQAGSPLNPGCDYWNNRIVVPLNFNTVASVCPSGPEERVIGSQLLIGAMASWQPTLCNSAGATYSYNTNPDSVARDQLLEGKADVAFTSYAIDRNALLDPTDQADYDVTSVSYAPVAIGALTVSFIADGRDGQITTMVLSPRILAKLLTQSYLFEVPIDNNDPGNSDYLQLAPQNRTYRYLYQDPDFQALNPNWADFPATAPSLILPGPADADVIAQLWKWIQSDNDARDFLSGKADPWGMKINPNYLPKGNPDAQVPVFDPTTGQQEATELPVGFINLDGSPQSLATAPLDYFPKADQAVVPHVLGPGEKTGIDSIQASPYVDDFVKSAVLTFRANPGAKISWDPNAVSSVGSLGDWVSTGPQVPGQRFVISITDAASTARYDLSPVALQAANGTTDTTPTLATMAAAVSSGLVAGSNPAVSQVDPTKVSSDGYPLTTVVYAAVNLTASKASDRASIAKMIQYVAGTGQSVGTEVGQLPVGYLPLTPALSSQASIAATAIASYVNPTSAPGSGDSGNGTSSTGGDSGNGSGTGDGSTPSDGSTITPIAGGKPGLTPASADTSFGQLALGLALGFGLLGVIFAPVLLRGWGRT